MNILIATTEAVPFCKTGGLADVCGSLPVELAKLGHRPTVILPAFRQVFESGLEIESTGVEFDVPLGAKIMEGEFLRSRLPDSDVPVYLVSQDHYFDRDDLYRVDGHDYKDNCERFIFFCRAVLEAVRLLDLKPDVIHANDWQTALIPAYLKTEYASLPPFDQIASLLTIHNLAYQGNFWHWDMLLTGLDWKYFNWQQMEFYGRLNLLKSGLAFADALNTVSPRYAEEIQTPELGCGMEGILQHRREDLTGIVNGVDYSVWNPATDEHLAANYDADSVKTGKPTCKRALQIELGLPVDADVPLVATVGRLADQKGFDLIAEVMQQWVPDGDVQWVILGTGEPGYHELFARLAQQHPHKVAVRLEFSNSLAHQIEAGADMFLMPSQYEPCGLNQLYSLKYGTVPVVRATGGLADTVTDTHEATLADGTANGFSFHDYSAGALSDTLARACETYRDRSLWQRIVDVGMRQDWSWTQSAGEYSQLYGQIVARHKAALCSA